MNRNGRCCCAAKASAMLRNSSEVSIWQSISRPFSYLMYAHEFVVPDSISQIDSVLSLPDIYLANPLSAQAPSSQMQAYPFLGEDTVNDRCVRFFIAELGWSEWKSRYAAQPASSTYAD